MAGKVVERQTGSMNPSKLITYINQKCDNNRSLKPELGVAGVINYLTFFVEIG